MNKEPDIQKFLIHAVDTTTHIIEIPLSPEELRDVAEHGKDFKKKLTDEIDKKTNVKLSKSEFDYAVTDTDNNAIIPFKDLSPDHVIPAVLYALELRKKELLETNLSKRFRGYMEALNNVLLMCDSRLEVVKDDDGSHYVKLESIASQTFTISSPDTSVTKEDMHEYGYDHDDMLPLRLPMAKTLFSWNRAEICTLHTDNTETVIETKEDIIKHGEKNGLFGIHKKDWDRLVATVLGREKGEPVNG